MRRLSIVLAVMMSVVSVGLAGESEVSASVDVASAYVFRGSTFNDGLVAQPGVEVSSLPFTFGVWGNLDIDDYDDSLEGGEFSEIDLYGSYDLPLEFDPLGLSVGYTEYTYPSGGGDADREVLLTAALDVILSPSVGVFLGVDGGIKDSTYIELGVEHEFEISDDFGCTLAAALGYLDPDEGKSGLSHADISASLSYGLFSAGVTHVARIDDDVLVDSEDDGSYDAEVVGSVGVGSDF